MELNDEDRALLDQMRRDHPPTGITAVLIDDRRHVVCTPYTRENLHTMARFLGLKRCWFHASRFAHYDLPKRWNHDAIVLELSLKLDEAMLDYENDGGEYEAWEIRRVTSREILQTIKEAK